MRIELLGNTPAPFGSALTDPATGNLAASVRTATATRIELDNTVTGFRTILTGTGFSADPLNAPAGTVTAIEIRDPSGSRLVSQTDFAWPVADLLAAMRAYYGSDQPQGLASLFGLQPFTIDAAGRTGPTVPLDGEIASRVTADMTLTGSRFADRIETGLGDDIVRHGSSPFGSGDSIIASPGLDTLDFRGIQRGDGFIDLTYHRLSGPVTVTIDGPGNTGTVSKGPGGGLDTILGIDQAVPWGRGDGLFITGTDAADRFVLNPGAGFIAVQGNRGADIFDITLSGNVRLLNHGGWAGGSTRGIDVDVSSGRLIDSFGFTDVLNITPGSGRLEIDGSPLADRVIGSAAAENFFPRGGNDTVDGGGGADLLSYRKSQHDRGVLVDLETGEASGSWLGTGFSQVLRNLENVMGTFHDDTLRGSADDQFLSGLEGDDLLDGRGGNDALYGDSSSGPQGNDTLVGGDGNDTLVGLGGDDVLRDGAGNDLAEGGAGDDRFEVGAGEDTFDGGAGDDTIVFDLTGFAAGAYTVDTNLAAGTSGGVGITQGRDVLISVENVAMTGMLDAILTGTAGANRLQSGSGNDRLAGDGGNDTLHGGDGADTLNGGDGDDVIRGGETAADLRDVIFGGAGNDRIDAGFGNDQVYGGDGNDTVEGGFGVDEIIGQGGNDVLTGSAFSDLIFGGDGNDFVNGGFGSDRVNGGAGADRFYHLGIADHGSDWIQDYSSAEGDVLVWGGGAATRAQFQVNTTQTAGAGAAGVDEAFVIYRPTGQILWALVDGGAQGAINIQIGGQVFDLLA